MSIYRQLVLASRKSEAFQALLLVAFFSFGLIGIINHEMWLDELHAWLIVRDSSSLAELFSNLKYELHPYLWYLCLYLISYVSRNVIAMQLLHLLLATTVIFIIGRYSPFTKLEILLFSFGYFPFYEYSIISRNYVLGILLIFLFCVQFIKHKVNYFVLSVLLSLLANTSVYGLILAITLALALPFKHFMSPEGLLTCHRREKATLVITTSVFLASVVISILQLRPPPDFAFKVSWLFGFHRWPAVVVTSGVWRSYVPIPNVFNFNFWNTNLLIDGFSVIRTSFFLSLLVLASSVAILLRQPIALFIYILGTCAILLFSYTTQYAGFAMRHYGHLFILFVACLWLSRRTYTCMSKRRSWSLGVVEAFLDKYRNRFVKTILALHLIAGLFTYSMDLLYPFSPAKLVAEYIGTHTLEDRLIIGNYTASTVMAFLDKEVYFLETERFGRFMVWNRNWLNKRWDENQHARVIENIMRGQNTDAVLILDYEMTSEIHNVCREEIANFTNAIVPWHGQYHIYRIVSNGPSKCK